MPFPKVSLYGARTDEKRAKIRAEDNVPGPSFYVFMIKARSYLRFWGREARL